MNGISVILITYNACKRNFLESSINSVLEQTFKNYELIIVNDGSTDNTESICKKYICHPKVRYLKKENGGPSSARNLGIQKASFDHITFLDDDDLFKKNMLQEMSNYLLAQTNQKAMVYCSTEKIDCDGFLLKNTFSKFNMSPTYQELLYGNFITTSAVLIDKRILDEIGLFDETLHYSEDYDLWLRIAKKYPIYGLNQALVMRRIHDNRLSSNFEQMQDSHYFVLNKNLQQMHAILPSEKNKILKNFYLSHASIYLGNRKYKNYRITYKKAKNFGALSFLWKIKYTLSFFPFFYDFNYRLFKSFQYKKLNRL